MKNCKYYVFCALLFVSSTAFAGTTYIVRTPTGYIIDENNGRCSSSTYITKTPAGYMISEYGNRNPGTTHITRTPSGYMIDSSCKNNPIESYINLNDSDDGEVGLYYGDSEDCGE